MSDDVIERVKAAILAARWDEPGAIVVSTGKPPRMGLEDVVGSWVGDDRGSPNTVVGVDAVAELLAHAAIEAHRTDPVFRWILENRDMLLVMMLAEQQAAERTTKPTEQA